MADDNLQVIRTFLNVFEAEVAQTALESVGIESVIRADDCRGTSPGLWMGGVELVIRIDDVAKAEEILSSVADPVTEVVPPGM